MTNTIHHSVEFLQSDSPEIALKPHRFIVVMYIVFKKFNVITVLGIKLAIEQTDIEEP